MKVAFCIRNDYKKRGGGDVVQMIKTKEKLENLYGIKISIVDTPLLIDSSYDICHVFNYSTVEETKAYIDAAKKYNCKIVTSPIYWDYKVLAYAFFSSVGFFKINKNILNFEIFLLRIVNFFYPIFYLISGKFRKNVLSFVENSDIVLPNSEEEMELLSEFIGRDKASINYDVVYNASESGNNQNIIDNTSLFTKLPLDFVLQVGRIEPIKNQLSIVNALYNYKEIPIVFVGSVIHEKYFNRLRKISLKRGNVFFVNEVNHNEVNQFYKRAKVHVLPSLRESPGLVSLEAMAAGCDVLVAEYPFAPYETYFKGISKFNPLDEKDIKNKILKFYDKSFKNIIEKPIICTWEKAAEQTYNAYKKILSDR